MLIASAETREAGAGAAEISAPASTAAAQTQRTTAVEVTAHHDANLPIDDPSRLTRGLVTGEANVAFLRSTNAQGPVAPQVTPAQAPGPSKAHGLQAGELESAKKLRAAHERKDAKNNLHAVMQPQTTAQPPLLAVVAVPVPSQPAQTRTSSSSGAGPIAESAAHSSQQTLHEFAPETKPFALLGARSAPVPPVGTSAPPLAKHVFEPAVDQAVQFQSIGPDAQSSDTRTESISKTAIQPGTPQGAQHAMNHSPLPAAGVAAQSVERETTANPAASDISLSIPHSVGADSAAPSGSDEKTAPAGKSTTAKSTEFDLRPNTLRAHPVHSAQPVPTQSVGAVQLQTAAMAARDASATNAAGVARSSSESSAGSPSAAVEAPAVRETFASLDAAVSTSAPTWIHASPHQAEAGFKDPALGWVAVRAQTDANGIHATLVPGSADAALSLSTHLAGLHAHLAEHQTPVATLTLAAQDSHWAGSGMGQSAGQNAGQGEHSGQQADVRSSASATAPAVRSHSAMTADRNDAGSAEMTPGGAYISVMA